MQYHVSKSNFVRQTIMTFCLLFSKVYTHTLTVHAHIVKHNHALVTHFQLLVIKTERDLRQRNFIEKKGEFTPHDNKIKLTF